VHGAEHVARAEQASVVMFGEDIATLPVGDVLAVFADVPSTELGADVFEGAGCGLVDLVARSALAASKAEARRLVTSGGVYLNNRRINDPQARITLADAIGGQVLLLRKGQRQTHLVRIVR
jgi:tyrosyl-tRNA synthetase